MEKITAENSRANELAGEILTFSRDTLLVSLRFLDAALNHLEFIPADAGLRCDGKHIFYDPRHILKSYREERSKPTRQCLHMIFHCVFQHVFVPEKTDRRYWNLACDMADEYAVCGLAMSSLTCQDEQRQKKVFAGLEEEIGTLTVEKIYKYYLNKHIPEDELSFLENLFRADDHSEWTELSEEISALKAEWQNISQRMQVDMETFTRRQGEKAGALMLSLREANREADDYEGFLRAFAVKGDGMKLNPDEFDYTMYSYGMQLSGGKIPFIEEVEYKDSMRIRDFALAVYPCADIPVSRLRVMLRNTWRILYSTSSFFSKVRLHVITLDTSSTECRGIVSLIETDEEMDKFVSDYSPEPMDNVDFRMAFNDVAAMKRRHEFQNFRGLMLISGTSGTFPSHMPEFPGIFIFINDNYSTPSVPAWAMRIVLQLDEIV